MDTEWVIEESALSKLNLQKMSKDSLSLGTKQTVLNNEVSVLGGCPQSGGLTAVIKKF